MASRASDLGRLTVPVPCFRSQISPHTHPDTLGSFQLFSRPFFVIFSVFWGFFFASQKIIQLMHGTIIHIWVPTSQFLGRNYRTREKKERNSACFISPPPYLRRQQRGAAARSEFHLRNARHQRPAVLYEQMLLLLSRGGELQTVPSITREVILQITARLRILIVPSILIEPNSAGE